MSKKKNVVLALTGAVIGLTLGTPLAAATLTAAPSDQTFYLDGDPISLTAYAINGNNYVKLRDVGKAVGFGVAYDAADNSVHIFPDVPYRETDSLSENLSIRYEIIQLVNDIRREAGVPELTVNASLMDAAQDCSAQGFTKHDPQYECEAILAYGYPYGAGANLTILGGVAQEFIAQHAVDNWVNSLGHYQTMVAERFDCIGVGVTIYRGVYYCYMFVGNPNSVNAYG